MFEEIELLYVLYHIDNEQKCQFHLNGGKISNPHQTSSKENLQRISESRPNTAQIIFYGTLDLTFLYSRWIYNSFVRNKKNLLSHEDVTTVLSVFSRWQ